MQSYTEADTVLTGRCKDRRKVANNTWLERRDDGSIGVRLHDTDVVTYHPDESITLNTGGWFTVTTKDRMNTFSPFGISSVKGEWQVALRNPDYDSSRYDPDTNPYWGLTVPYRDHMRWDGQDWHGIPTPDEITDERARRKAIRNEINAFIKGITPDDIVRQFNHPQGDCWGCMMFGTDDCLADHVDEHYFHLSLARRAVTDRGYRMPDVILSMILHDAERGQVSRDLTDALRKFLVKRLITGVAVAA